MKGKGMVSEEIGQAPEIRHTNTKLFIHELDLFVPESLTDKTRGRYLTQWLRDCLGCRHSILEYLSSKVPASFSIPASY